MTLVLRYAARSDRGLVRANNEDSVYAGARLLALADGMGGHAAGEVASQLVIAALAHLDDDEPGGDLLSKLDAAVREGNSAIAAHVEADPELEGMGTTLTAILFAGNRLGLVHIGDSRGYLLRDGELAQITKDDTFVQTLVDEGRITAEEAHSHPQRSLIMRALTGHEVEPTLIMREARAGDRYLLCSDGLSDPVSHETILEALQIADVAESADRLIELALRGGGPDNVTVVVADVVDYDYGQTQPILAGAVSGDDDQAAPPNTAAGSRVGVQPAPQRGQTRRAAAGGAGRATAVAAADVHRRRAAGSGGACRPGRRPRDRAQQLLRHRARRHRVDHARCSGLLSRHSAAGAVPVGLSQRPQRVVAHQPRRIPRQPVAVLGVNDMRPSERAQVVAGLPSGTLDDAIAQIDRACARIGAAGLRAARPAAHHLPHSPTQTIRLGCLSIRRHPVRGPPTTVTRHLRRRRRARSRRQLPPPRQLRPPPGPPRLRRRAPVTPAPRRQRPRRAVPDPHRAAPTTTGTGNELPGSVMTTQPQSPVAVTPPLPNRRNAELFLLGFAA